MPDAAYAGVEHAEGGVLSIGTALVTKVGMLYARTADERTSLGSALYRTNAALGPSMTHSAWAVQ
jgi:hypothetical protein